MYVLWCLSVVTTFIVEQAGSAVVTWLTLLILCTVLVIRGSKLRAWVPVVCDYGIILFCALQIAGISCGIYPDNSVVYTARVVTAANIYFIMRLSGGVGSKPFRALTIGACFMGLGLAVVNIPATVERLWEWRRLELANLMSFRAYFSLAGGGTKTDSLTLALVLLPFSLIILSREKVRLLRIVAMLSAIGSCVVIVMGMSRGVYLGYLSLCLAIFTTARAHRIDLSPEVRRWLIVSVIGVALMACCYTGFGKHLSGEDGGGASSQIRSISGRLRIWNVTLANITGHELLGIGGGNGALYVLQKSPTAAYQPFTSRTYNWVLEILLQNGIAGVVAFCAIVISTLRSTWRLLRTCGQNPQVREVASIIQGTLVAVLISDLTYTSLVLHPPIMSLIFAMAGAINGNQVARETPQQRRYVPTVAAFGTITLVLLIGLCGSVMGLRMSYSEMEYSRAQTALEVGDYNRSLWLLARSDKYSQCDALYASMKGLVLERSADQNTVFDEVWQNISMLPDHGSEQIKGALQAYQRASKCAPMDAAIQNNLAWLYAMLGDDKHARERIGEAIRIDPNTALYHVSSGLLYERNGQLRDAYREYSEAIAISPSLVDSEFFAELRIRHKKEIIQIQADSKATISQLPNTPMRTAALASLSYAGNDYIAAKSGLAVVLRELPNLSSPWNTLGKIAEFQGDIRGAEMDYRRALFVDPFDRVVLSLLANTDYITGRCKEGLWAAQRALMVETPSEHAVRSISMYSMNPLSGDDVVPTGLLYYVQPRLDIAKLCRITYQMSGWYGRDVSPQVVDRIRALGGTC